MKTYRAAASKTIKASPETVYAILADYRSGHSRILPRPYFFPLTVVKGGTGAGTVIRFQLQLFRDIQTYRAVISEPQPGRLLEETYLEPEGIVTRFLVEPSERNHSKVTITTEGKIRRPGLIGSLERLATEICLRLIFQKELGLLAAIAEEPAEAYFRRERLFEEA